jgi:hypothetical protein
LDIAIAGGLAITVTTTDVTLTLTQGTSAATNIGSTTAQYAILNVSGAMTAARNLILPSSSRQYIINNNTTGGFALTVKGSATSGVTMVNGEKAHVFWNGSDYAKASNTAGVATFTSITNSGLTSGRVVYSTTGGLETDSAGLTFDGTNFATTGTATAAKLIPTGSSVTGNGMYLPAANALGFSTAGTNAVYIDATQNVGIGTTSPAQKLDVKGVLQLTNVTTPAHTSYVYDGGGLLLASNNSNPMYFYTGAAERMRIDSSGNLLVGTTSALSGNTFNAVGGAAATFATTTSTNFSLVYFNNGTYCGSITTNGSVTSYNVTSDQRLKENIQDAESASALIDSLQVRQFDWKYDNSHQRYGFVAQELVTVAPEAVFQPANEEEMMAVDYSKLVPMLVKEIQSLRKRLTALEST